MPDVNLTINAQYSKEEIIELIKKDLKEKYPSFDLKNIFFNVKDMSKIGDRFTDHFFADINVILAPSHENWTQEIVIKK